MTSPPRSTSWPTCRSTARRVVTIGHSAGGHLAAWAATREDPRVAVTGVVSQAGVLDLQRARELRPLRRRRRALPAATADARVASPIERLPLGVPGAAHARRARRHRARWRSRSASPGDRRDPDRRARRGPLRPPRPGQPALEGGGHVALTRERRRRSTRATRWRRSATAS